MSEKILIGFLYNPFGFILDIQLIIKVLCSLLVWNSVALARVFCRVDRSIWTIFWGFGPLLESS